MTDDKYTPSTEEVRYVYGHGVAGLGDEFDRWLKGVRAEAWDAGVEAAHERLRGRVISSDDLQDGMIDQHSLLYKPVNPYKEEK